MSPPCNSPGLRARIDAVFVGKLTTLPPEGQRSGIYKHAVSGPVAVTRTGLRGDHQGDLRVHGGPEKAVHHFAAENYAQLAAWYPRAAAVFIPGSIGENLTTQGLYERNICIGDIYRAGSALLQVSQPRSPCWKINHRYALEGLAKRIHDARITGWYYRVLETGALSAGDVLELVERNADPVSLDQLWRIAQTHRPAEQDLCRLRDTPGLAPEWQARCARRIDWLRENS